MENYLMMQFFEWNVPNDGNHWERLRSAASHLNEMGYNRIWIPPCMKGSHQDSTGYDVYDLYDLGEFMQKDTVRVRYGEKIALKVAIDCLHSLNIQVIADVVLNHKAGADETECFKVVEVRGDDRLNQISEPFDINGWTKFNFSGRGEVYSNFKWNFNHFTSTDRDELNNRQGVFKILGENKDFSHTVDTENSNFDYLMFSDIDLNHTDVVNELKNWSAWFINELHIDGFRMDAIKHMDANFVKLFFEHIRSQGNEEFFVVGEYWNPNLGKLQGYLEREDYDMHLFDVGLHYNFVEASQSGRDYDLSKILYDTLVSAKPMNAVTFVDNHDSQGGMYVGDWFKPISYALIMLRYDGYPCIFYGDYYGISGEFPRTGFQEMIDTLSYVRKSFAYGEQRDYFNHTNVIGWVRLGDEEHSNSGVAILISNGDEGYKDMWFSPNFGGKIFYDIMGGRQETVTIEEDGKGLFTVNPGSVSVWIEKIG
ncbi:MAG: alpha-amylase [Vallitaleaceae bacterium]|nr:alpha-amylase [Vallitaleaceae bacterium]